jgi:hypothetical protein
MIASEADPWHIGTDPDPLSNGSGSGSVIFVSNLQEGNKKLFLFPSYFAYYFGSYINVIFQR